MDYDFVEFGDCRTIMRGWAREGIKAQTCVTSPPYFGLRDYGVDGQIGLEQTPEEYVDAMVEVFRCVRDVLADDGTLWLNLGDSWGSGKRYPGIKQKDLIGIPWMLAFALRNDGWYLRQDIIWHKPNPMNESVNDRCTKAHEYVFLLSKKEKYFYDREAIREPIKPTTTGATGVRRSGNSRTRSRDHWGVPHEVENVVIQYAAIKGANKRSVWSVPTKPFKGAHAAVFPPTLIEPCILAGSRPNDVVLDPFMGSGTTAMMARKLGRRYIGCELNESYGELQDERIRSLA